MGGGLQRGYFTPDIYKKFIYQMFITYSKQMIIRSIIIFRFDKRCQFSNST